MALTFFLNVFVKRLIDGNQEIDGDLRYGPVDYVDHLVMDKERRENFENRTADFLFSKHQSLSNQREFRLLLPNIQSEVPYFFMLED